MEKRKEREDWLLWLALASAFVGGGFIGFATPPVRYLGLAFALLAFLSPVVWWVIRASRREGEAEKKRMVWVGYILLMLATFAIWLFVSLALGLSFVPFVVGDTVLASLLILGAGVVARWTHGWDQEEKSE